MKQFAQFFFSALMLAAVVACNPSKTDTTTSGPAADSAKSAETPENSAANNARYAAGDMLYVYAHSGLVLRDKPDINGAKLQIIPIGAGVEVVDPALFQHAYSVKEACGLEIKGFWVQIKYDEKIGYLFDGYLLPQAPPLEASYSDYWDQFSGVESTTNTPPKNDIHYYEYTKTVWKNGVVWENSGYEGGDNAALTIPKGMFSFQEVYVFAMSRMVNDPQNKMTCKCDVTKETMECNSADELALTEIEKDADGNFIIRESYAD